jgi:hypothetical protein
VTAAEVMALIHTVPGVCSRSTSPSSALHRRPPLNTALDAVPAFGARYDAVSGAEAPAELLLINPAAITLVEMAP